MHRGVRPELEERVVLVTGANTGIGQETAVGLARLGAAVVITSRHSDKGRRAVEEVRRRSGNERVCGVDLDLASFRSVRSCASEVLERFDRLDVLVANAGLVTDHRLVTDEGFEMMFGVNHLGHFLLASLLLERLLATAPARIVVVTSVAHRMVPEGLHRTDLQHDWAFNGFNVYAHSKLANVLFTRELARRLEGSGVTANCCHPGLIRSRFARDGDARGLGAFYATVGVVAMCSPRAGARTPVHLATSPAVEGISGGYWSHRRRWPPSRAARDDDAARWLWDESERLVAAAAT